MNLITIESAQEKLKRGLPIIFQTDTLPAIGCLPNFSQVIYEVKKRDKNKPLILMGADSSQLDDYVHDSAKDDFAKIASHYWPGALTIVIPVSEEKKSTVTSTNLTLGLRIPNSKMTESLIKKTGPLLTSSANISGMKGSIAINDISLDFPNIDILGPVPWPKCSGSASTIISWTKCGSWRLIREGQVKIEGIFF
tara:strand:+ start:154 stop:738 length:585 start_codon:yes stop_codon:yes gene_type:complete